HDPHIWFDVTLWMKAAATVRDALIDLDPNHKQVYLKNHRDYLQKLEELDAYVRKQVNRLSDRQRQLVTAHDAFSYFARTYGFQVHGLQGISTATEAGTRDVQKLAQIITESKIRAIFVESSVPVRNIEAVQAAVQAHGFQVQIGGELFSDAMGDA